MEWPFEAVANAFSESLQQKDVNLTQQLLVEVLLLSTHRDLEEESQPKRTYVVLTTDETLHWSLMQTPCDSLTDFGKAFYLT